jgi:DNA polymerase I-like protein with 3'-5' exonuclease and polymerase domains
MGPAVSMRDIAARVSGGKKTKHIMFEDDERVEWAALTFLVEGSAADIIKVAMIHISQAINDAGLKSRMLLQVENELLFEVAGGEPDTLEAHVREHGRRVPAPCAARNFGRIRT